jgi:pimeloyl-ACP methyl ester carboxylesterase
VTQTLNAPYAEKRFRSQDDLELYYRDYGDPLSDAVPVVCLSGLTRNSKDFHLFASALAPKRRVVALDYRGRGRSAYDPNPENYAPKTYVGDVVALLAAAGIKRAVFVGTSLGGICTMVLSAVLPAAMAGAVLNDVGPEMDPIGLSRIATNVGTAVNRADYNGAVQYLREAFASPYPDLDDAGWMDFAHRLFTEDKTTGGVRLDYDLNIAVGLRAAAEAGGNIPSIWPFYHGLKHVPVMVIRGVLSDILSDSTFRRMADDMPQTTLLEVPNRGHVPLLHEPTCLGPILKFLDGIK